MSRIQLVTCNQCGQVRWSVEDSPCSMTLGCTGKMKRAPVSKGKKDTEALFDGVRLSGDVNGVVWVQQAML